MKLEEQIRKVQGRNHMGTVCKLEERRRKMQERKKKTRGIEYIKTIDLSLTTDTGFQNILKN